MPRLDLLAHGWFSGSIRYTRGESSSYGTMCSRGSSRAAEDRDEPLLHIVGLNKAPSSERRLVSSPLVMMIEIDGFSLSPTRPSSS
jgi:hypothetical protein